MRHLRQQCQRRLREISLPDPFDLDLLCERVAQHRGRRIQVKAMPGLSSAAPCGMWIALRDVDYILYEANTSRLHSEHIILHEIGHILSCHALDIRFDQEMLARLVPSLSATAIERVLGRVNYTNEQEQEAEMIASLLRARGSLHSLGDSGRQWDRLSRMAEVFSYPRF